MSQIEQLAKSLRTGSTKALVDARRWLVESDDDVSLRDMHLQLVKAGVINTGLPNPVVDKPRALFQDPYSVSDWGGWRQRPNGVLYQTLNQMSVACAPIAAIIQVRTNQVGAFCRPQKGRWDAGYRVIMRDRDASRRAMTPAESRETQSLERMFETTGVLLPGEKAGDRDSFKDYAKASVRDILRYDAWATEIQRDSKGRPSRFNVLDASTIRPAVVDFEHLDVNDHRQLISHVQVWEDQAVAEFTKDQLMYQIMNPRSDLHAQGFGLSPVEQVIRLTTAWLFGFDYNQNFFKQGSAIKGLINIKGTIPDRQMRAFRRMWYSMVGGVENAWKTPILNAEGVEWMSMHSANREMEFSQWMDWLTKLITSIFAVDPTEINFTFGNTGQTQAMSESSNEEKVVESKDKGLRPLVEHIQDAMSQMVQDINPDFEFAFAGLDVDAERREKDGLIKESAAHLTVNEARAALDLPPLPGERGDVIRDINWKGWVDSKEGQPEEGGEPGEEPDGAPAGAGEDPDGDMMDGTDAPPSEEDQDEADDLLSFDGFGDDDSDEETDLLAASMSALDSALTDTLRKAERFETVRSGRRITHLKYTS